MKREIPHDQVLSQESKVGLIFKYQVINKQKKKTMIVSRNAGKKLIKSNMYS